jgi:N-ethylmaleimide reductase
VADYRHAARNAMAAGFDGVEVHGANGYLLDQFLRDSINDRTDAYGGTIANRCRVVVEIMQAVVDEIGADRCGIRLSPVTPFNDCGPDSDAQGLFNHLMGQLAPMKLAFMHVIEGSTGGPRDFAPFDYEALHAIYKQAHPQGVWMLNNGYDRAMALEAVASGLADAVAFGKPFISNPDLVRRLREDAPLNALDAATMFGGNAKGYIDYPALESLAS